MGSFGKFISFEMFKMPFILEKKKKKKEIVWENLPNYWWGKKRGGLHYQNIIFINMLHYTLVYNYL